MSQESAMNEELTDLREECAKLRADLSAEQRTSISYKDEMAWAHKALDSMRADLAFATGERDAARTAGESAERERAEAKPIGWLHKVIVDKRVTGGTREGQIEVGGVWGTPSDHLYFTPERCERRWFWWEAPVYLHPAHDARLTAPLERRVVELEQALVAQAGKYCGPCQPNSAIYGSTWEPIPKLVDGRWMHPRKDGGISQTPCASPDIRTALASTPRESVKKQMMIDASANVHEYSPDCRGVCTPYPMPSGPVSDDPNAVSPYPYGHVVDQNGDVWPSMNPDSPHPNAPKPTPREGSEEPKS